MEWKKNFHSIPWAHDVYVSDVFLTVYQIHTSSGYEQGTREKEISHEALPVLRRKEKGVNIIFWYKSDSRTKSIYDHRLSYTFNASRFDSHANAKRSRKKITYSSCVQFNTKESKKQLGKDDGGDENSISR